MHVGPWRQPAEQALQLISEVTSGTGSSTSCCQAGLRSRSRAPHKVSADSNLSLEVSVCLSVGELLLCTWLP